MTLSNFRNKKSWKIRRSSEKSCKSRNSSERGRRNKKGWLSM